MENPLYSIVISFYNEERPAGFVITRLLDHLNAQGVDFELLLVNNGSRDGTATILASFAQRDPRISCITLPHNVGFGGGTFAGLKLARGKFIGFTTAGGQVLPEHVLAAFAAARENPAAVVKAKRMSRESVGRSVMAWGYSLAVQTLFGFWMSDIDGHPLVLARDVFDALEIRSNNLMLNLEILIKARKHGRRILQLPIPYGPRASGKSHTSFATVGQFVRQLIAFRRATLFHG